MGLLGAGLVGSGRSLRGGRRQSWVCWT